MSRNRNKHETFKNQAEENLKYLLIASKERPKKKIGALGGNKGSYHTANEA
jgi:hypothetical protein